MPTLDGRGEQGYGVCEEDRDAVPAHVWNRFGAGLEDEAGSHLVDGLLKPRTALVRAGFGAIPWNALGAAGVAACVGASWTVGAVLEPDALGAERFGRGFVAAWEPLAVGTVFAAILFTLQAPGPAAPAPWSRTVGLAVTGGIPAYAAAVSAGLLSLALPMFVSSTLAAHLAAGVLLGGVVVSAGVAGYGVSLFRGGTRAAGIGSGLAALLVTFLVTAVGVWLRLNPPWGSAWDLTG